MLHIWLLTADFLRIENDGTLRLCQDSLGTRSTLLVQSVTVLYC
jgi:hypothetical protein